MTKRFKKTFHANEPIDGTRVKYCIRKHEDQFVNRKRFYSTNM